MTAIGYTHGGLPEPTLADLCHVFVDNSDSTSERLYASAANQLIAQLEESVENLSKSASNSEASRLAEDSAKLLIQDAR